MPLVLVGGWIRLGIERAIFEALRERAIHLPQLTVLRTLVFIEVSVSGRPYLLGLRLQVSNGDRIGRVEAMRTNLLHLTLHQVAIVVRWEIAHLRAIRCGSRLGPGLVRMQPGDIGL